MLYQEMCIRDSINILYFGVPIQMLFNNFTGIARALGASKRPLYFLVISVVVNLFLDILLVKNLKKMCIRDRVTTDL